MKFEELKSQIENRTVDNTLIIFKYEDVPFVAYQWCRAISKVLDKKLNFIESIDSIINSTVDIFGTSNIEDGLRIYSCDEFNIRTNKLRSEHDLIIITKKIDKESENTYQEFICNLPKLEGWHIKDYVYSVAKGVSQKELDWFIQVCNNDIYRIENELDKLRLFNTDSQKFIFEDMKYDGAFKDLSTFNVFNITNAVTSRDMKTLVDALREIKSFDAEPLGVVTLLYQGFKKLILVWLASNPTSETTGLNSKMIYAINKSPRVYNKTQVLKAYQLLNNIDKMLKTGKIEIPWLIDYVICKILTF